PGPLQSRRPAGPLSAPAPPHVSSRRAALPAAPIAHAEDLADFVDASPSSYHAATEVARRLQDAGFAALDETQSWPHEPGRYLVVRDGALIAWVVPSAATTTTPVRVFGAHTDSPGFKL